MSTIEKGSGRRAEFSELIIVGAGVSGIAAAIHYQKKFGGDYTIFEKNEDVGGTWWVNTYPGCAVDIPAMFYSFSFEPKYNWTQFYPNQAELLEYTKQTTDKYGVTSHIQFNTTVEGAEWIEDTKRWRISLRRESVDGGVERWAHECKVFMCCVGGLTIPKKCDIPGSETFRGKIFHSALWDHSAVTEGKDVIVVGNGCSAAQLVPKITPTSKSTTQFMRSAQWMMPRPTAPFFSSPESYAKNGEWYFKNIPFLYRFTRFMIFSVQESLFLQFKSGKLANKERERNEKLFLEYMKAVAPEKYHDIVLPKYKLGCKRRVLDDGYLANLHAPNMNLTNDLIEYIGPDHVMTKSGVKYPADVIVLANGFDIQQGMAPFKIIGRGGESLTEHWKEMGGPAAYNTCAINGFPNFFMTFGPNSVTGHSSVLMGSESVVEFALKVSEPVFKGQASDVEVTREAELKFQESIQEGLKNMVWSNGNCRSWYVTENGRNSTGYPFSQLHLIWRCMFPTWSDWSIKYRTSALFWILFKKYMGLTFVMLMTTWALTHKNGPSGAMQCVASGVKGVLSTVIEQASGWWSRR